MGPLPSSPPVPTFTAYNHQSYTYPRLAWAARPTTVTSLTRSRASYTALALAGRNTLTPLTIQHPRRGQSTKSVLRPNNIFIAGLVQQLPYLGAFTLSESARDDAPGKDEDGEALPEAPTENITFSGVYPPAFLAALKSSSLRHFAIGDRLSPALLAALPSSIRSIALAPSVAILASNGSYSLTHTEAEISTVLETINVKLRRDGDDSDDDVTPPPDPLRHLPLLQVIRVDCGIIPREGYVGLSGRGHRVESDWLADQLRRERRVVEKTARGVFLSTRRVVPAASYSISIYKIQ